MMISDARQEHSWGMGPMKDEPRTPEPQAPAAWDDEHELLTVKVAHQSHPLVFFSNYCNNDNNDSDQDSVQDLSHDMGNLGLMLPLLQEEGEGEEEPTTPRTPVKADTHLLPFAPSMAHAHFCQNTLPLMRPWNDPTSVIPGRPLFLQPPNHHSLFAPESLCVPDIGMDEAWSPPRLVPKGQGSDNDLVLPMDF